MTSVPTIVLEPGWLEIDFGLATLTGVEEYSLLLCIISQTLPNCKSCGRVLTTSCQGRRARQRQLSARPHSSKEFAPIFASR